jgi:FtsZ-binding cell division protein ZapB
MLKSIAFATIVIVMMMLVCEPVQAQTPVSILVQQTQSEIQQLRMDVGNLKRENQQLRMDVGNLTTENQQLRSQVNQLRSEVSYLGSQLTQTPASKSVQPSQSEIQQLRTDVGNLKTENQQLRSQVNQLQNQVGYFDSQLSNKPEVGLVLFLFGTVCALWAQNTRRNPWLWFFLGFFFHVITVLFVLSKNS